MGPREKLGGSFLGTQGPHRSWASGLEEGPSGAQNKGQELESRRGQTGRGGVQGKQGLRGGMRGCGQGPGFSGREGGVQAARLRNICSWRRHFISPVS